MLTSQFLIARLSKKNDRFPFPKQSLLFKKCFYFLSTLLISITFRNILPYVLMKIKIIGFKHTSAFPVLLLAYSVFVLVVSSTH